MFFKAEVSTEQDNHGVHTLRARLTQFTWPSGEQTASLPTGSTESLLALNWSHSQCISDGVS